MRTFEKPLSNHWSYELSDLFDRAYRSIINMEVYEIYTLLQLRITAKSQMEERLILNKETINSDVPKYKPVLLSVLKVCIMGLKKVLLEHGNV